MTIHSVEQVLDSAIALLMYGSGSWFSYSLVAFIVTRPKAFVYRDVKQITPPAVKPVAEPVEVMSEVLPELVPVVQAVEAPLITCQPVSWKKWKVGELRQANITHVCGVRISPIGSSRKLTKADLIAQYEQNLKRMTYEPPALALQSEKIA